MHCLQKNESMFPFMLRFLYNRELKFDLNLKFFIEASVLGFGFLETCNLKVHFRLRLLVQLTHKWNMPMFFLITKAESSFQG